VDTLNLLVTEQGGQTEEQLESLTQKAEQTQQQLDSLTGDLETICSKLESLTATTTQLSTDLQEVQTSISNIACSDSEETSQLIQNLQDDITTQLTGIDSKVDTLFDQRFTCGGTGGWRRAVYLDLSDETTPCPNGWELTSSSPRTCGRSFGSNLLPVCHSATFPVSGGEYNRVCGRIKGYQFEGPRAFFPFIIGSVTDIDGAYAYGISLTNGSPRNHIWTFAAGFREIQAANADVCPCSILPGINFSLPPFVGEDFFCESGINTGGPVPPRTLFTDDVLWDGEDCDPTPTCCPINNPPFFTKQLPCPTSEAIEARICGNTQGAVAIELVELYVQ